MRQTLFCLLMMPILAGCNGYVYQPDNLVEEIFEEGAKAGAKALLNIDLPDIDVTPGGTPEKGFNPKGLSPVKKVEN